MTWASKSSRLVGEVVALQLVNELSCRDDKDGRLGSTERQSVGSERGVFSADPQNQPLQGLAAGLAQRTPELVSDGTLDGAGDKGASNDGALFHGGSLGSSKGQVTKAEDLRPPEPSHREEREKGLMAPEFVKEAEEDAESREVSRLKTQIEGLQAKVEMFSEMMEMWEAERTKYRARIVVKSNMDNISNPDSLPGASLAREEEGKVDDNVAQALQQEGMSKPLVLRGPGPSKTGAGGSKEDAKGHEEGHHGQGGHQRQRHEGHHEEGGNK